MLANHLSELSLPIPVYFVVTLVLLSVHAFRHPEGKLARWRWLLVALTMWSWLLTTPALANLWLGALEHQYPRVTDGATGQKPLIVVLTSGYTIDADGHVEAKLDLGGWERVYAGIALWRRTGGKLLFVGGPSPGGAPSTSEVMAAVARDAGVPPEAIEAERKSATTAQNLRFSKQEIAARGDDVWLVTSAIHMPRAMGVARALDLHVRPYPCDFRSTELRHWYAWLPNAGGPALFADALHETLGIIWYRLRGYARY